MSSGRIRKWDRNYCFHITDFHSGDSLIAYSGSERVKGRVESIDEKRGLITYRTSENKLLSATLNEIIYLGEYKGDWI